MKQDIEQARRFLRMIGEDALLYVTKPEGEVVRILHGIADLPLAMLYNQQGYNISFCPNPNANIKVGDKVN
jgi:hypothetical protein